MSPVGLCTLLTFLGLISAQSHDPLIALEGLHQAGILAEEVALVTRPDVDLALESLSEWASNHHIHLTLPKSRNGSSECQGCSLVFHRVTEEDIISEWLRRDETNVFYLDDS